MSVEFVSTSERLLVYAMNTYRSGMRKVLRKKKKFYLFAEYFNGVTEIH